MASTASTRLRLELQADGENDSTWGSKANAVFNLIEEATDGYLAKSVAGSSNVTLTSTNFVSDESRQRVLSFTGTLTGNINVIVPATEKFYIIHNATSGSYTLTFKPSGGTGVVMVQGNKYVVYTDGSTMFIVSSDVVSAATTVTVADESSDTTCFPLFSTAATGDLGPKTGSNLAFNSSTGELTFTLLGATTLNGAITGAAQVISNTELKDTAETVIAKGNFGATPAFDVSTGNVQWGTVNQNITSSTMTNWPATGKSGHLELEIINGAAFSIVWPTSVDWVGGTAPTLTTSGTDKLIFKSRNAGTTVLGFVAGLDVK
jgi:hypothetical protein